MHSKKKMSNLNYSLNTLLIQRQKQISFYLGKINDSQNLTGIEILANY